MTTTNTLDLVRSFRLDPNAPAPRTANHHRAPEVPRPRTMPAAIVRVHGRRVSWSMTPDWSPRDPAFGPAYSAARAAGLALTERARVGVTVRRLLREPGITSVVVYGLGTNGQRITVTRRVGNDLRTAWSETDAWGPHEAAEGREYDAARELGLAGVTYGAAGLDRVLAGGR